MNNYILEYYQQIKDGTASVSNWTRLVYEYIVKGLETRAFFYASKKANAAVLFLFLNRCRWYISLKEA